MMLLRLIALCLALLLPVQGWAANSLGGIVSASGVGTTATTGNITPTPTAGSTIVVVVRVIRDNAIAITVSDNKSNSYSRVSGDAADAQDGVIVFAAYNINTSAAHTVTVQFSDTNANYEVGVVEIKGADTTNSFDVQAPTNDTNFQSDPGTATDAVTSTAATTTADGDFILGANVIGDQGDGGVGTGFTNIMVVNNQLRLEYRVQPTAGSIAATFTLSFSHSSHTLMAAFKAAGAGGGGATPRNRMLMGVGQ